MLSWAPYAVAAQVIPLLFIVLVFEVHLWDPAWWREGGEDSRRRRLGRIIDAAILALIVAGEYAAASPFHGPAKRMGA